MLSKIIYNLNKKKKYDNYVFESKTLAYLFSFAAGMMGVYTYKLTNGIFADGLTGDLLYISINVAKRNLYMASVYFLVLTFFSIGVIITYHFKSALKKVDEKENGFRRVCIILEVVLLVFTYFIDNNYICLFLISMVCGIQIEIFDNLRGYNISTVNYVGNTRQAAEFIAKYIEKHEKKGLLIALWYYLAFLSFFLGGVFCAYFYDKIGKMMSIICAAYLMIVFILSIYVIKDKLVKI